jgi:glycerophosphoryl diester phosphodiesterase
MEIIEQYIQSKTGKDELCEDGIVVTEHFIAVIDGVTNKSSFNFESKNPGRIAAELIQEAIENLPPGLTSIKAIKSIDGHIRNWYEKHGLLEDMLRNPEQRCTAATVIYSASQRELWLVGDCQALVNGKTALSPKKIDGVLAEMRAILICTELVRGKTEAELLEHDTGREGIVEFLKRLSVLQNAPLENEYTFYAIDGFEGCTKGIQTVPVPEGAEVVMASDGYPRLFPTLKESETWLECILRKDPLCYKLFRSTKGCYKNNISFDDRAYIRFR